MTLLRRAAYLALPLSLMACAHHRGGPAKADIAASKVTTIGVNAYLWRATLDTLSFMKALDSRHKNSPATGQHMAFAYY